MFRNASGFYFVRSQSFSMGNLPPGMFSPSAPLLRKNAFGFIPGLALHTLSWLVPLVLCDFLLARAAAAAHMCCRKMPARMAEWDLHALNTEQEKTRAAVSLAFIMLFTMLVKRLGVSAAENAEMGLHALNRLQWNKEKVSQIASLSSRQRLLVLTQPLNDFSAVLKWLQHFQMSFVNWILSPHWFFCVLTVRRVSSIAAWVQTKCPLTVAQQYKEICSRLLIAGHKSKH